MEIHPWFEAEGFRSRADYLEMPPLQRERIDQYRQQGYAILDDTGIDGQTLTAAISGLSGRFTQSATGHPSPGRIQDAWQTVPAVNRIATAPAILEALRALYRREPIPFQTPNFERGTQ